MKNKIIITVTIFLCLSLALPSLGYSRRYWGPYRGCYGCGYRSADYWVPAAIVAGTLITGAIVIGAIASQNARQSNPPQQTSYRVIDTRQPYAAPDPDFINKYSKKDSAPANTSGQWVTVPGQWVGDKWVPSHRVFAPNP